ncbi:MAG: hypothetical protein HKO87_03560 [Acidimicrobiia bacterium]|nr:hypothetical protein [Acidimicrobiia bacterium]NNK91486.1 hypothetical protein [Acidimicrobiia bacterium]
MTTAELADRFRGKSVVQPGEVATPGASSPRGGSVSPVHQGTWGLAPGRTLSVVGPPGFGLTRVGLAALADQSRLGPVAYLDVRGWLCPAAAWEVGIEAHRLIVVRCDNPVPWARVAATLVSGLRAVFAEVPSGAKEAQLRKLAMLAKTHRTALVLRPVHGDIPAGVSYLRLEAAGVDWAGAGDGHGRLEGRRLRFQATGKGVRGMTTTVEFEDHGTDPLRVVSGLAIAPAGHAIG